MLVLDGFDVTVRSVDGTREFSEKQISQSDPADRIWISVHLCTHFRLGLSVNAVTEEKENRTIEILSTSMSANEFILGKVLGIVMVIFTQVISWILFFVIAFFGARAAFDADWIDAAQIDFNLLLILLLLFIPAFFFFSGIALTISSMVTDSSEGAAGAWDYLNAGGVLLLVRLSDHFQPGQHLQCDPQPDPVHMPTLMPLRFAFGVVPWSQIALGIGIMTLGAVFTIWLAARAYELGMMQYGKRIRLGELLRNPPKEVERNEEDFLCVDH